MALKIRQRTNQEGQVASSFLNIGNSYMLLNMPDSSLIYFRKGLDLANKLNIDLIQVQGNKYFYEWYLQKRDWKNALDYYRSYVEAKDSLSFAQKEKRQQFLKRINSSPRTKKSLTFWKLKTRCKKPGSNITASRSCFLGSFYW